MDNPGDVSTIKQIHIHRSGWLRSAVIIFGQ